MRNKMIRLMAIAIALLMFQSLILAGCGDKKEPVEASQSSTSQVKAEESSQPKDEGLKGDFEVQIFEGGFGSSVWKNILDGFKKENPEVNIIANIGPKVNEQLNTRWISDNPPDFIFLDGGNIPKIQWIKDGKLMDLTEWFKTAKSKDTGTPIKDKLLPNMLRYYDGKNYEAPIIFNTWGMWYDEKLFNDNGVTPPTNFEELLAVGEQLKAKNIPTMCYTGVYSGYLNWGFVMPAIAAEGGEKFLNELLNSKNPEMFKSQVVKNVFTKLKTLVDKGYMMEGTVALDHTQSQMEWLNRRAALIPNGLWLENEMKKDIPADFKMKFIPSVSQDKGQKMTIMPSGITVGIASKAKNPEAAKAFLEYIYRDENLKSFVEATGSPSACKIDIANANVSEVSKDVMKKISSPDVQFVAVTANTPGPVDKAFNDTINAIVLGKVTVDEACERLYKAADSVE